MNSFARVAVPRPLYQTFLYRIPDSLRGALVPGSRVVVPFGRRQLIGWVDDLVAEPEVTTATIRDILDAPDDEPVLDREILELCRWVARYYVAPLGQTYRAALPASLSAESSERIAQRPDATPQSPTTLEKTLLDHLAGRRAPVKLAAVGKALGPGPWTRIAHRLASQGVLRIERRPPHVSPPRRSRQVVSLTRTLPSLQERDRTFGRARRQRELFDYLESVGGSAEIAHLSGQLGFGRSVVHGLAGRGLADIRTEVLSGDPLAELPPAPQADHTPTDAQAAAIRRLLAAAETGAPGVFVLKGVTGSGKTLVYIELVRELVSRRGRGAILLVPEIALTPQTLGRFRAAFGDDVALIHSALSDGERYAAWQALRRGEKRIVIGARSAVFAPVRDLGAIIIDEEHEGSYKQSDPVPRYHARDVAVVRSRRAGAVCLLGSATPSLEAWSNVASGTWQLLELPERIGARPMPAVEVIDLREARKSPSPGDGGAGAAGPLVLSDRLRTALAQRLERDEQTILMLNRRGYSTFAQCRDCGAVRACWQCNVSLTEHRRPPRLVCHHCNHQEPVPEVCPECGSDNLSHRGLGTEQVERVLGETYPAARVARMDVDTTSGKWSHHEILARVERGAVDILLGTQMIAKGLDFPRVTLVGVINADVGLNIPDFRASERTFQLLTQVAGRAGRGPAGGEVIIQTSLPNHYAIDFALSHNYNGFAVRELEERAGPRYPPHTRLANIVFSGRNQVHTQEAADSAASWLEGLVRSRRLGIDLVGPAPCPIDKIRGRWRWHLLAKADEPTQLGPVLRFFAERFPPSGRDLRLEIDRDPVSLL